MDIWKYFSVTHQKHRVMNPMSLAKLEELVGLFDLPPATAVVDIACGKGEFLARLAEKYGISGVGVDISPFCVSDARQTLRERVPAADIEIVEMGGADYRPDRLFGLSACIGATWIFDGYRGTLQALKAMTEPGGLILVGEAYWLKEPEEEFLAWSDQKRETYGSHFENVRTGEEEGLVPLYTLVSNHDDWDRYETLQWYAVAEYARQNPADPDLPEITRRVERNREEYLRWARDTFGWALYLFRKPVDA